MQKNVIQELIKEANKSPTLEYSDNILIFKDNLKDTISQEKTWYLTDFGNGNRLRINCKSYR